MQVETVKFFHQYQGVDLVAVCQGTASAERRHAREVWIYPDGKPMEPLYAQQLLAHLRDIDPKEVMECDVRLNWLVTEFLDDCDAHKVHFDFSVKQTLVGLVVAVVFWSYLDAPNLEDSSLETSE